MSRAGLFGLIAVLAGCSAASGGENFPSEATGRTESAVTTRLSDLAQYLVGQGVVQEPEAARLMQLGQENGWTAFRTPGVVGTSSVLTAVVVGPEGSFAEASEGTARCSDDGWTHSSDRTVVPQDWQGRAVMAFGLGTLGSDKTLACAFRVRLDGYDTWLNNGGKDYRTTVRPELPLAWVGSLRLVQDGLPRTLDVDPAYPKHGLTVEVSTYPQTPQTDVVLHYTTDGFATVRRVRAGYLAVDTGPHGQDTRWAATIPASELQPGKRVEFWVEATNPHTTLWDSRHGSNYGVVVASAPPPVVWAEAGAYHYQPKYGPWSYRSGVADPLTYTMGTWLPPSSPPHPAVQLYIPGVTDRQDARDAAGQFVRVEVWSPFFSGSADGPWKAHPLSLREGAGNDWRFSWQVHHAGCSCEPPPGADSLVDHGVYPYKYRVSTDGGETWSWVGSAGVPYGGDDLHVGWFINHHPSSSIELSGSVTEPWGVVYDVGSVQHGKVAVRTEQLVNQGPVSVTFGSRYGAPFLTDDGGGSFSIQVDGCDDESTCQYVLEPGDAIGVTITFAPVTAGEPATAVLEYNVTAAYPGASSLTEGGIIRLQGASL